MVSRLRGILLFTITVAACAPVMGQGGPVPRGVAYLRGVGNDQTGELALAALAMAKAGVPASDPDLVRHVGRVMQRFNSQTYSPQRDSGPAVYEAGVTSMLLSTLDPAGFKPQLQLVAAFLVSKQKANGSWDYEHRTAGDTSISQYAVLGLWEAENAGVRIAPAVWERVARWYIGAQSPGGSWNYHRDEQTMWPETVSMTAAGVGSLLICKRQLAPYRRRAAQLSPLLIPLDEESQRGDYRVGISEAQFDSSISRGITWLGGNFNLATTKVVGPSIYYGLYGVERVGSLSGLKTFGSVDWYAAGAAQLGGSQGGDGSWNSAHGPICNTAWALMFLARATEKTIARITVERLGGGTLLGGRGLPEDLSSLTVAGGRVVVRPMNGGIEDMLAVLEDPRARSAESALSGLVARYNAEGPKVLQPLKDRFRKLRTSRDPGLRRTAVWALARMGELDVVPDVIASLTDPDEEVVSTATYGLKLLSRKLDGYGPAPGDSAEAKAEAARKWADWLESVRPLGATLASDATEGAAP